MIFGDHLNLLLGDYYGRYENAIGVSVLGEFFPDRRRAALRTYRLRTVCRARRWIYNGHLLGFAPAICVVADRNETPTPLAAIR